MAKNTQRLEARLAKVEGELAELKATMERNGGGPWYRLRRNHLDTLQTAKRFS